MEKKWPRFTFHAELRAKERFDESLDVMLDDIKHHRQSVWLKPGGVFWVRWKLGIYVIDRNFTIITVYKNDKEVNTNTNVINRCDLFHRHIKDPRDFYDRRLSRTHTM